LLRSQASFSRERGVQFRLLDAKSTPARAIGWRPNKCSATHLQRAVLSVCSKEKKHALAEPEILAATARNHRPVTLLEAFGVLKLTSV
jgi:hypothetical protein